MRRRQFIGWMGRLAAGLGILSTGVATGCRRAPAPPKHWTWVHGGRERSPDEWRARFAQLRAAGIVGVLVGGGEPEPLAEMARAEGLEFHRWMWTLNRNGDAWVKEHHPEWFTVSREGKSSFDSPPYVGYYKWLCPTRPEVRAYLRGKVGELAALDGIDGVHLDYVRHADVILPEGLWSHYDLVQDREYPPYDFCYCDVCRETFAAESGTDPLALADPTTDPAWREFRWQSVTGLVEELADACRARGKQITAAVFPTPTIARRLVRQAWETWPLDAVFPMIYHEFYNQQLTWIATATHEGVASLPTGVPLYSGLYIPNLTPEQLGEAVHLTRDAGAAGVSLFQMDIVTDDHLSHLT